MKKFAAVMLVCIIVCQSMLCFATDKTVEYIINTVKSPTVAQVGGEWGVIGIARSGAGGCEQYLEAYYNNVVEYAKQKNGILHSRKNTEYSRVVVALTAIGKDPCNVSGYDFTKPLYDFEKTVSQGINGAIWALIALDTGDYGTQELRKRYTEHILNCQNTDGGWSLSGKGQSDADITAMALCALAPYREQERANDAVEKGILLLSAIQNHRGGFGDSSESVAQVLTAMSALGISADDSRFVKNDSSVYDNIMSFSNGDGSFCHRDTPDMMATEQCLYAVVSAQRLSEGKTSLFDMSDVIYKEKSFLTKDDIVNMFFDVLSRIRKEQK